MRAWLVRAGLHGEGEQFALERSIAGIGWPQIGDYADAASRDDVLLLLREIFPDDKEKRLLNFASQLWAFLARIQEHDLVVLPLKTSGNIAIGSVTGPFRHEESNPVWVRNVRPVRWLRTDIPREVVGDDLLRSLNAQMTVCELSRNRALKRLVALAETGRDPGIVPSIHQPIIGRPAASGNSMLLGAEWNQHTPPATAERISPSTADPDTVGRGANAHFATLLSLAAVARDRGLVPLDSTSDCPYDLAWRTPDGLVVVEVKSITPENEAHQIRYGIGQVLDYRYRLRSAGHSSVQAALVLERQPATGSWATMCADAEVTLGWPGHLDAIPGLRAST